MMGMFNKNQKQEPMHYGEVFVVWSALSSAKGQLAGYLVYYNHAGDEDLKIFVAEIEAKLLKLNKKKGWLIAPSLYKISKANQTD